MRNAREPDQPGAETVTVFVPMKLQRRSGRKRIIGDAPPIQMSRPPSAQSTNHQTILKALGRAWRWKQMLESGDYASITDLANAEKVNHSYVRRLLRLTLLSPEIVEAVLDGRADPDVRLEGLLQTLPNDWCEQKVAWRRSA